MRRMSSRFGGSGGPTATRRRAGSRLVRSAPWRTSDGPSAETAPAGTGVEARTETDTGRASGADDSAQAGQLRGALRRAGPLAFAGVAANVANIIVTVAIAHLLSSRDYGSYGQLLVLFLVLSMPGSALLVAVVRRVTAWSLAGQADRIGPWVARVRRWGLVGLAVLAVVAWLSRYWIASLLSLPSPEGVAEFLIAGGAWGLLSFERGLIQADRNYSALAWNLSVQAGVQTTLTVLLVAAGLSVEGAALAFLVAMAAAIAQARFAEAHASWAGAPSRPAPERPAPEVPAPEAVEHTEPEVGPSPVLPLEPVEPEPTAADDSGIKGRHLAIDLVAALAALFFLASLQGLDVEIVGRASPGSVGSYNAISVACKAVVFLAIVLSGYLLPEAVVRWRRGGHALSQLGVALGLVAVPVVMLVILAAAVPDEMLRILFGGDKAAAAPAFATLALAMGFLAASTLFTYYLLGIGRRWVLGVLALATVVTVVLVTLAHGHAVPTARAELASQGVLALVLGGLVVSAPRRARVT